MALRGGFGEWTDVGDIDGEGLLDLVIGAPDDGYGAIDAVRGTELQVSREVRSCPTPAAPPG